MERATESKPGAKKATGLWGVGISRGSGEDLCVHNSSFSDYLVHDIPDFQMTISWSL